MRCNCSSIYSGPSNNGRTFTLPRQLGESPLISCSSCASHPLFLISASATTFHCPDGCLFNTRIIADERQERQKQLS